MADKDRRKKEGRDTSKDAQAMRNAEKERHKKTEEGHLGTSDARNNNEKPGTISGSTSRRPTSQRSS